MPRTVLHLLQMMIAALMLGGCAEFGAGGNDCSQLSGTYENRSTGNGDLLAAYLFTGKSDRAATGPVTLRSRSDGGLEVSSGGTHQRVLDPGRDFRCVGDGLRLLHEDTDTVGLASVMSTTTVTRYTFSRTPDGDLQMNALKRATASTMGVRIPGPHEEVTVQWKRIGP